MIAVGSGASDDGDRQTQLLRGALDMCLLALLARRATHGYELVGRLEAIGIEGVGYGTIYPLLTRMRRLGLVVDEVQASPTGPPRKVYAVTDAGQERLDAWRRQWTRFVHTVNTALTDSTSESARS
ncbi:PadR family transcriptional regulator [Micromonospora sp. NPDC049060]|uniref:PadR family transcriptional regulator n=1 Tax=Micromonospora sp. NPDC049060 TaxID=3154828 RepID=UPI0033C8648B